MGWGTAGVIPVGYIVGGLPESRVLERYDDGVGGVGSDIDDQLDRQQ
jgi:hypothetical protein